MLLSKKIALLNLMLYSFFLLYHCNSQEKNEIVAVDFSKTSTNINNTGEKTPGPIKMAISAMISPKETYIYYQQLINYISRKSNTPIALKQRKTYQEINDLLKRGELDFAFICSGAYIQARKDFDMELLVVPIVNNKAHYHAYIITHKDSSISKFEDLYKHRFAFTDLLSNTGRLYPLYLISQLGKSPDDFFSKTIFTHAHDYSIYAVSRKIVEGASVDSLIFDYLKKHKPETVADVKIIKKSQPFGIPPIVVNRTIDSKIKKKVQKILLNMHRDEEGKRLLTKLLIDKFSPVQDSLYNSIRNMEYMAKKGELTQKNQ